MTYTWLSDGTPVSATLGEGNLPGRLYNGSFVFVTDSTRIDIAESVAWDEGRIFFLDTDTTDCWYAGDHLGNVRSVIDISRGQAVPQVLEQSDYLPYGTRINNTAFASMSGENRWRYAGKEEQRLRFFVTDSFAPDGGYNRSLDLGLLNFGARMYDPFTARWMAVDPLSAKFESNNPFGYCNCNPILIFDSNGADISFMHWITNENMNIGGYWAAGVSDVVRKAVENFAKTEEGFKFLSRFARAGDKIGSITFTEDGDYANYELSFREYNSPNNSLAGSFYIDIKSGSPLFSIKLNLTYDDDVDLALTIGHEAFIHMNKSLDEIISSHFVAEKMDNPALFYDKIRSFNGNKQKEIVDHKAYIDHPQDSHFSNYVNQLKGVFNPDSVIKARYRHDRSLRKRLGAQE